MHSRCPSCTWGSCVALSAKGQYRTCEIDVCNKARSSDVRFNTSKYCTIGCVTAALQSVTLFYGHIGCVTAALQSVTLFYGHIGCVTAALLSVTLFYGHIGCVTAALQSVTLFYGHIGRQISPTISIKHTLHLQLTQVMFTVELGTCTPLFTIFQQLTN